MSDAERGLPTAEDLLKIPRWARVAFAARCARRVQPLWHAAKGMFSTEQLQALDHAVEIAEAQTADAARTAAFADAARAATAAAAADANANAAADAGYAADAAAAAAAFATFAARVAVRADFNLLRGAAVREGWTDETPVPPSFFGPLWPEGPPAYWPDERARAVPVAKPADAESDDSITLRVEIPDGASDEEILAFVRELANRADDLHRAFGGHGLKVDTLEADGEVPAPVGGVRS